MFFIYIIHIVAWSFFEKKKSTNAWLYLGSRDIILNMCTSTSEIFQIYRRATLLYFYGFPYFLKVVMNFRFFPEVFWVLLFISIMIYPYFVVSLAGIINVWPFLLWSFSVASIKLIIWLSFLLLGCYIY